MLGQLIRFGLVGGLSSLLYSVIYLPLATYVVAPVVAVPIAFGVAVVFGYVLHSGWSFKGHGSERTPTTQGKFLLVQGFGMVLNAIFTWVMTGPMHWPVWSPLVATWTLVPLATFFLQRWWVFG